MRGGEAGGGGARVDPEFAEDRPGVGADGAAADEELCANLVVVDNTVMFGSNLARWLRPKKTTKPRYLNSLFIIALNAISSVR